MKPNEEWLTREAAIDRLTIRQQTLYAYVSRGLIRTRADGADSRRNLYSGYDVQLLLDRKHSPRRRNEIAAAAIAWGEPVLESAISTVRDGRLVFRGRDAIALAADATLEQAAALLWQCNVPDGSSSNAFLSRRGSSAKQRIFDYLAAMAGQQPPSYGRSDALLHADAWSLLYGVVEAAIGGAGRGLIHQRFVSAWQLDRRGGDLLRRALVLISDHELNASTFAVRVAASTGASLAASSLAGFCALSGPLHGQASMRSLAQLDAIGAAVDEKAFVAALIERGEMLPGFGHPLYPSGDIRAISLLRAMKPAPAISRALRLVERASGRAANIDMALAALTRTLRLPDEAPVVLFAIGRMAGWLAHAIEQKQTGRLIRPRARYVGL